MKLCHFATNEPDGEQVHEIINSVACWSEKWILALLEEKTNVLHVGNRNARHEHSIKDKSAKEVREIRDLKGSLILMINLNTFEKHDFSNI